MVSGDHAAQEAKEKPASRKRRWYSSEGSGSGSGGETNAGMLELKFSRQPTEETLDGLKPGRNPWQSTKRRTKEMLQKLMAKMQNEEGQGLVEYALIIVLISIVCVVALGVLGTRVNSVFCQIVASF
jgi:pilus assembly protein Flp/PilA